MLQNMRNSGTTRNRTTGTFRLSAGGSGSRSTKRTEGAVPGPVADVSAFHLRAGETQLGKPANTGMRRILLAARCSAKGFGHAWKYEAAFRQEIALTLMLAPLAMLLGRSGTERIIL